MSGAASPGALLRTILHNDLRLFWRGGPTKKRGMPTGWLGRIGIVIVFHLAAFGMLSGYSLLAAPPGSRELAVLIVLLICGMVAVHQSLEVLYNRGDLALLLSSPVPARVVLLTRLCDIGLATLLGTVSLILPLLDVAIVLFGWHWAWGFLTWFSTALLIAPVGILVTLVAVAWLGPRRARALVTALGLVLGMGGVLAMQLPTWLAGDVSRVERHAARAQIRGDMLSFLDVPPLRQLADLASGNWNSVSPWWLVALVAAAAGTFAFASRILARQFVSGAQAYADGDAPRRRTAAPTQWHSAFARPRERTLLRTDLLLLRRDPLLLVRCGMQIVSLVPMLVGATMLQRAAGIGGVGLLAAGIVPVTLAAMLNANDEAHEFVAASPLRPRERARARAIAAATVPGVFALIMAGVVAAMASPTAALLVAGGGVAIALASGWVGTCTTRPHTAEERARNRPAKVAWQTFLMMLIGGIGAAGVGMVDAGLLVPGLIAFAASMMGVYFVFLVAPKQPNYAA